ncbi:MAG: secretin N-terminal domain-containing protein [Planctomycetota bacterium]
MSFTSLPTPSRRGFSRSLLLLTLLALSTAPLSAQGTGAPAGRQQGIRVEGDDVVFAMDEKQGVPLMEFIKFAQQITKKAFVVDQADPSLTAPDNQQGRIQLMGTLRIKVRDFFAFFQTMLYIKGFVCVPRRTGDTEFIEIIGKMGGRSNEIKQGVRFVPPDEIEKYRDQTGTFIVTTINMQHVDANIAMSQMRAFYSDPQGLQQLLPIGGSKAVLMVGFGPTVYMFSEILKLVDVRQDVPKATLSVIGLEYSSVEDIEPVLSELVSQKARVAAQPQAGRQIPPEELVPTTILANTNNNTLIVYAHEDKIREIENMVAQLDVKLTEVEGNYHVYVLKNTQAKELRQTLSNFLRDTSTASTRAQGARGGQAAAAPGGSREQAVVIIDDENSNSLLISASRTQYDRLKELIEKLDVKQPQVLIETALIELGTQDVQRLGVELGLLDLGGNDFTRPFGFTSFGISTFEDSDGNGLPDTRLPDFENPLQGITGGILSSDDFAIPVLVNALKSNSEANVLSIPSVLVNNNKEATIESREDIPTQQSNANVNTTTSGFSGFQPAGITLRISPSISEGNYLRMGIDLEISNFTEAFDSNAVLPPPKTTRIVKTEVTMPSSHTMVLGGVIEDQTSTSEDGIPFLKDLPLLGILFRRHEKVNRKTNLYFFVTPHILDEDDFSDLADLTFRKKLEAAKYIGHRRVKIIDRKWRGTETMRLDDTSSTIEDLDRMGGFDIPSYQRPPAGEVPRSAPGKKPDSGENGK